MRSAYAWPPVVRFCAVNGLLAVASVLGSAGMAAAQAPTFVDVANSGQSAFAQARQFSTPSLNDNGQTAFRVGFGGDFAFYRGNAAGGATMVASSVFDPLAPGNAFSGFDATDINDAGTIAFTSYRNDGPGPEDRMAIHTIAVGGPLTVVADNQTNYAGVGRFSFVSNAQVNDRGTVTFGAFEGIFRAAGGTVTSVVRPSQENNVSYGPQGASPHALNDNDAVAYRIASYDFQSQRSTDAKFVTSALTTGRGQQAGEAAPGPTFAFQSNACDLNDSGTVLFGGTVSSVGRLYLATAGSLAMTPVVDPASNLDVFVQSDGFALGDDGSVAFLANANTGRPDDLSLYAVDAPGGVPQRILKYGDALFGSTLVDFRIRPGAVNADGSIAFNYELADGTIGVAVALVPEPTSLAALAGVGMVALRRRRA